MLKKLLFLTTIAFLVTSCTNVEVPNIVGEEASYARGILKGKGFEVETTERVEDGVQPGQVLSQEPPAEASINKGSKINLIIAKSPVYQVKESVISVDNTVAADQELQIKAQEATVETYEIQGQSRIEAISAERSTIEAQIATGQTNEIEGEKKLTELKAKEFEIQLDTLNKVKAGEDRIRNARLKLTLDKFDKQIANAERRLAAAKGEVYVPKVNLSKLETDKQTAENRP